MNIKKHILVADDQEPIRATLQDMLVHIGYDTSIASDIDEAEYIINNTQIDLAFIDICFSSDRYNGFDIVTILQKAQPSCQIIVLTANPCTTTAVRALRSKVLDYIEKPVSLAELTSITQAAFRERTYHNFFPPLKLDAPQDIKLTDREAEILLLLAKGFPSSEIGQHLDCKTSTVQWHVKNVYRKLGVSSKSEAIYEAICLKLINIT